MIKKVNENYVQVICEECGSIEAEFETIKEAEQYEYDYGYVITFNGDTKTMYECCESDYRWCDGCDTYHYVYDTEFYSYGCYDYCQEYALEEGYIGYCHSCEELMDTDYLYWHEGHGEYYCEYCYPQADSIIAEWHEHKQDDIVFYKADSEDKPKFYFGIELEIDKRRSDYNYNNETAETIREEHFEANEMYFEEDGSLWGGFEIITQPMSYEFILENKDRFADLFNYLDLRGYTGEDNSSAGLHFHISNDNITDEHIHQIIYFLENNLADIHKLSRRPGDLNRYANSYCFDSLNDHIRVKENEGGALDYNEVIRLYEKKNYSRYHILNTTNEHTIEFRFFKSTLNIDHFIGSIQFINTLVNMTINGHLRDWHTVNDIVNYTDTAEISRLYDYIL